MGIKKTATMMEVANRANVSIATVARVIHNNGYVSAQKRKLIQQAIEELGYVVPVKETVSVSRNLVGVLTPPDRENPFFSYLPHALGIEANKNGLYVMLRVQQATNQYLQDVVQDFISESVCGIVIVGFEDTLLLDEAKDLLLGCGVPVVFVERTARCYGLIRVLLDGGEGIFLATRHLIEQGHKHFLYIGQNSTNDVDKQRLKGYQNALAEIGIHDPPIVNPFESGAMQAGYDSIKIGLEQWPQTTAVVAWSDLYAVGAMQYCFDTGRRVPQDIAITGFDDIYAPAVVPPLTSVKMPLEEMAQAAIQMIVESRNQTLDFYSKTITLSPKLSVRKSSGM